ncbi:MAG TPA: AraC family transcriptional regulator [Mycobacteriales bacterium]|jgi:AraC family L-rhamnose operon transcriptional activator RhaR|nr:AraC family transcriptional regulator [Mycobacteriales bacterium]
MHRLFRRDVFPDPNVPVAAQLLDPVGVVPPHGHDFLEIAVITRGSADHVSATGRRELHSGSVLIVRPGAWHGYETSRNLAVHNVYIGPELFRHKLSWVREDPQLGPLLWPGTARRSAAGYRTADLAPASLNRVQGWLTDLQDGDRGAGAAWWLGHLLLVVNEIAGGSAPDHDRGAGEPHLTHRAVLQAARLLEDQLDRPWTLAELARSVNMAPSYLVRLFTTQVGIPPLAHLSRLRAERAAGMLIETELPVSAIGTRVGWHDPNYMSRRFRACFGLSPSQYRASFRG